MGRTTCFWLPWPGSAAVHRPRLQHLHQTGGARGRRGGRGWRERPGCSLKFLHSPQSTCTLTSDLGNKNGIRLKRVRTFVKKNWICSSSRFPRHQFSLQAPHLQPCRWVGPTVRFDQWRAQKRCPSSGSLKSLRQFPTCRLSMGRWWHLRGGPLGFHAAQRPQLSPPPRPRATHPCWARACRITLHPGDLRAATASLGPTEAVTRDVTEWWPGDPRSPAELPCLAMFSKGTICQP